MKTLRILLLLLVACLLTQCAHNIKLPLQPNYEENLLKGNLEENTLSSIRLAITFQRGQFSDERVDTSKLFEIEEQMDFFYFHAERPIEDTLFDGLKTLFTDSGHEWSKSDQADIRVDMQLIDIQGKWVRGGTFKPYVLSNVQIMLNFIDTKTDDMIYTQVYNGIDDEKRRPDFGFFSIGRTAKTSFTTSLNTSILDCINNVGQDGDLVTALKKFRDQ